MKFYKSLLISSLTATLLSAMDPSLMPPMIPNLDAPKSTNSTKPEVKAPMSSCEMIPPMIINLPPPLEDAVEKCKNERDMPQKDFVQTQLSKLLKKTVHVQKIEIVKGFNQLYKVSYDDGTILCNKAVNAFIKQ